MKLDKSLAEKALDVLDKKITEARLGMVHLAIGGGGSMMLNHDYVGMTMDIDAVPTNIEFDQLKPFISEIATELKISADWLNPYYGSFTHYLPQDSHSRMQKVFSGQSLQVNSLGAEDIIIMKLMAGRNKDRPHIMHLKKKKLNLKIVEKRLEELLKIHPSEAQKALDLFDEYFNEN